MGVYARDSRFWWMLLEGTRPQMRISTGIPIGSGHARKQSEQDAEAIYRAAMGDLARGTFRIPGKKATTTFRLFAEWYRDHVLAHHRGAKREAFFVKWLIEAFGDSPLRELTERQIAEWKTTRAAGLKPSSFNRELAILKAILRRAVPEYLDGSPADAVKLLPIRNAPITILSESAETALLEHASPAERAMVLLGVDALLRFSDVRTLRAEHDRGTYLDVVNPKTTPYKVPVSTRLRAALDALTPYDGWYFPSPTGRGPLSKMSAWNRFRGLCDRAGVKAGREAGGMTFHGLRHTGATRAARVVKLTVVQRLGGWSNLKQLERYDHPEDAEIVRAVEAIGARHTHGGNVGDGNRRKKTGT